jgi:drug/metabolite transporter (DMT)-like permease
MSRSRGALLILAATLCWSTGGVFVRAVEADAWTIVFWRSLALALVLAAAIVLRHGRRAPARFRAIGWAGLLSALLVAASFVFFILAISLTLIANVLVIMSAAPLISALLGRIALGERLKPATLAAIGAAACGIAVMVWDQGTGPAHTSALLGGLCAFVVAVTFGANIVVIRAARHVDMLPAMSLAGLIAALAALAFGAPAAIAAADTGLLVTMGCVQLALGLFLFVRGAPHLTAAEVGLLTLFEVVLAPIWVWIGFDETPSAATLAGGAIVITALAAHSALGIRRSKPPVGMA